MSKQIYILKTFSWLILTMAIVCVASAWATVAYITPHANDGTSIVASHDIQTDQLSPASKVKAPEPATMALFGGGLFSMIIGFVRRTYAALKRFLDVAFSAFGLILISPILLLITLAVKLTSRGPIIYSQTRVGKNGGLFEMYKFRTMNVDAEKGTGAVWAKKNDSRLTPIGKFLRHSHLDELPQLWNVLKGEMSIIGPRPERPVFVEKLQTQIPGYTGRLAVKPGITGLAQVRHRYDETIEDVKIKVKYDLMYIKKICLLTDFQIALRTFRVMLTGEGAK
ncbi:MAG: exopolysaccharide biosynthesis polyprenyl glycosylphosphotransferase [Candidatus Omnitrophica bacterium]|nr:exopolysaccharide biosynthesis polyprenyl glycosylphosphotransferase [Candidatus Omnitrophota bacterium]